MDVMWEQLVLITWRTGRVQGREKCRESRNSGNSAQGRRRSAHGRPYRHQAMRPAVGADETGARPSKSP